MKSSDCEEWLCKLFYLRFLLEFLREIVFKVNSATIFSFSF